ncbi:MAG: FlgD immunoglobulin-like domain containing protein [Alphaproteobacteria bacterium]|nr:FlgD immunoglobulin-like domain containing protein [Alphaproteobacteria bacterium]
MSVGAVSSLTTLASNTASSASSAASQASSLSLDFQTYLEILTTQLQHQDPTNATDPNQFTQELIMMEQVQAQINNNEAIENLTEATTSSALASGVGFIGKYVRAATENGDFSLKDSSAEIGYTLDEMASSVTVTVKDSDGNTITSFSGGTAVGDNYVTWDGTLEDGSVAEDGAYTFSVSATDSTDDDVDVKNLTALFKITAVSSASNQDGVLVLDSDSLSLLSTDVTGIYTDATKPASTTASYASAEDTATEG